jgi:hypothetical protein
MFQWLTKQFRPYTVGTFGGERIEELVPGHWARMARMDHKRAEEDRRREEQEARALKRTASSKSSNMPSGSSSTKGVPALPKKTAAQRSKVGQAGTNTERLRKLEHHLAGLRRSLD